MNGKVEWPERQQSVLFAGTCCKQFQFHFRVAGSVVVNTSVAARHAAALGPALTINVPNVINSKHERASRAQADTKSLKLQLSEKPRTLFHLLCPTGAA
jgi:hypothetical protein